MISVKVSYSVNPDFVNQNRANINAFLNDFRSLASLNFLYNVYLQEDGLTFLHIAMYESEEVQNEVLSVPSFLHFQQERDAKGLSGSGVEIESLSFIGSSLRLLS